MEILLKIIGWVIVVILGGSFLLLLLVIAFDSLIAGVTQAGGVLPYLGVVFLLLLSVALFILGLYLIT